MRNQFKVIPLAYTFRTGNLPKFSATSDAGWQHGRYITQLQAANHYRILSHTRPRRLQNANRCAQIADFFEPNTVLWAFHTIQPSSFEVCFVLVLKNGCPNDFGPCTVYVTFLEPGPLVCVVMCIHCRMSTTLLLSCIKMLRSTHALSTSCKNEIVLFIYMYIAWLWRNFFIPVYAICPGRRDVRQGNVNILQHFQSDRWSGASTKPF